MNYDFGNGDPTRSRTRHLMAAILLAGSDAFSLASVAGEKTSEGQELVRQEFKSRVDAAYALVDFMMSEHPPGDQGRRGW